MVRYQPVSAEQSATQNNDNVNYGAGNAIDLVWETHSITVAPVQTVPLG